MLRLPHVTYLVSSAVKSPSLTSALLKSVGSALMSLFSQKLGSSLMDLLNNLLAISSASSCFFVLGPMILAFLSLGLIVDAFGLLGVSVLAFLGGVGL